MRNERLERALIDARLTKQQVARACNADPKTVERWITQGRVPWLRHQHVVAELVGLSVRDLWPDPGHESPELIELFPHRAAVPPETWLRLVHEVTEYMDVLAWAATFFHEIQPRVDARLGAAAERGARVRLCLGDPSSPAVAARELEEPLLGPGALAHKIRSSLGYYRELVADGRIEVRLHRAVVYASLFRYDDEMIVNPHVYSRPAGENPALHLRRGTTFNAYAASFDVVWDAAIPWKGEPV